MRNLELPSDVWNYILELRTKMMALDLMERVTLIQTGGHAYCTEKMYLVRNAFHCLTPTGREKFRDGYDYLLVCHTLWYTVYYYFLDFAHLIHSFICRRSFLDTPSIHESMATPLRGFSKKN